MGIDTCSRLILREIQTFTLLTVMIITPHLQHLNLNLHPLHRLSQFIRHHLTLVFKFGQSALALQLIDPLSQSLNLIFQRPKIVFLCL